jgi:hypothetical protein
VCSESATGTTAARHNRLHSPVTAPREIEDNAKCSCPQETMHVISPQMDANAGKDGHERGLDCSMRAAIARMGETRPDVWPRESS